MTASLANNFDSRATAGVDIAARKARVAAFFDAVITEHPVLADQLTVVVTTPGQVDFIRRAKNDRPIDTNTSLGFCNNRSAYVQSGRICIYIGPDNTYEPLGSSIETVLAHELGHWLDGADTKRLTYDERQRAECIADVFAGLLHLRAHPGDRAGITHEFRRILATSNADPQRTHYTLPALVSLLNRADMLYLEGAPIRNLVTLARVITHQTYAARGTKTTRGACHS